jgi:pSer/pThr/pTyr-binding forkhead associated (FHA) protein
MDVKLVMFKSNGQQKEIPLVTPVTCIGRGEACDLRVPLVSVSRRHCEVALGGDRLRVKDLASSNGTFVNNKKINEAELKAGDRLAVGQIVFTIQIDGQPSDIKAVKTKGQKLAEAGQGAESADVDVFAASADDTSAGGEVIAVEAEEDVDPIAALEAMAAETKKPKKK